MIVAMIDYLPLTILGGYWLPLPLSFHLPNILLIHIISLRCASQCALRGLFPFVPRTERQTTDNRLSFHPTGLHFHPPPTRLFRSHVHFHPRYSLKSHHHPPPHFHNLMGTIIGRNGL